MIRFSPLLLTLLALARQFYMNLRAPRSSIHLKPSKFRHKQGEIGAERSAVAGNESGKSKLTEVRTSSGMFITKGKVSSMRLSFEWIDRLSVEWIAALCCLTYLFRLQRRRLFWSKELQWASGYLGGTSFDSAILRLRFAAIVYDFWLERNARVFAEKVQF